MGKLRELLVAAKRGREPWEEIPRASWPAIAAECGAAEREEIAERLATLRHELAGVEPWDGDTRDDVWRAIEFFEELLALSHG
jgi:hypothetical protein